MLDITAMLFILVLVCLILH